MPYLDARAIEIDPEGLDHLRRVIATAAGGALAYDPDAYVLDGDRLAVARPLATSRLSRGLFSPQRKQSVSRPSELIWA